MLNRLSKNWASIHFSFPCLHKSDSKRSTTPTSSVSHLWKALEAVHSPDQELIF